MKNHFLPKRARSRIYFWMGVVGTLGVPSTLVSFHTLKADQRTRLHQDHQFIMIRKPKALDRESFYRSIGALPHYTAKELDLQVGFDSNDIAHLPAETVKLRCNLKLQKETKNRYEIFEIKKIFPSLRKLVSYVRKNLDDCHEWLLPNGVSPSQIEWFEGEYKIKQKDTVSEVLYAIGALPLWEPWGVVRLAGSNSNLSSVDKISIGSVIKIEKTPVIRKCNAVFEEGGHRFHLADPHQKECPRQPSVRKLASVVTPLEAPEREIVTTQVISPQNETVKSNVQLLALNAAALGNSADSCNNESALLEIRKARSAEPERVDLGVHEIVLLLKLGKSSEAKDLSDSLIEKSPALSMIPALARAQSGETIPEADRCSDQIFQDSEILEAPPDGIPGDGIPALGGPGIPLDTTALTTYPEKGQGLSRNVLQDKFSAFPLEASFAHTRRYSVPVSLTTPKGATILQNGKILNSDGQGLKSGFNLDLEVTDRKQCATLQIIERNLKVLYSEVCFELEDADLERLGLTSQAFYWRKNSGFWAQGGLGFVSQSIPGVSSATPADNGTSVALRAGIGAWWKKLHAAVFYRRQILSFANKDYNPSWLNLLSGYSLELPQFLNLTTFITPMIGMELYRNSVATDQVRFVKIYNGLSGGLEARFVVGSRFEIGGTYLLGGVGDLRSSFLQGDARYWFDSNQALGFGSWWTSMTRPDFTETGVAGEVYYRRILSF